MAQRTSSSLKNPKGKIFFEKFICPHHHHQTAGASGYITKICSREIEDKSDW